MSTDKSVKVRGLGKPEVFDFLGFTHICGRSPKGDFQLRRQPRRDRLRAKLREIREVLWQHRHAPMEEQGSWLRHVVTGWFAYHAVPVNGPSLHVFRDGVICTGGARYGAVASATKPPGKRSRHLPTAGSLDRASFIPGPANALPLLIQGESRMPSGPYGSGVAQ